MENSNSYIWNITDIKTETDSVKSLYLSTDSRRPDFKAGQYLTVKIPGLVPNEGKAYSISSAPNETLVRLTIKKIGLFSSALFDLSTKDNLITSAPYGYFYPEVEDSTPLVMIAGGIGITPLISLIKDFSNRQTANPIHLFYSNRTVSDIIFRQELTELMSGNPLLFVHHFITRESVSADDLTPGHLTSKHIDTFTGSTPDTEYLLCGSINFTRALWKMLRDHNIPQHKIYTEGFF